MLNNLADQGYGINEVVELRKKLSLDIDGIKALGGVPSKDQDQLLWEAEEMIRDHITLNKPGDTLVTILGKNGQLLTLTYTQSTEHGRLEIKRGGRRVEIRKGNGTKLRKYRIPIRAAMSSGWELLSTDQADLV